MVHQQMTLSEPCGRCGSMGYVSHAHRSHGGLSRYSEHFVCERCGSATHADGDHPPELVRRAFLERDGTWELCLTTSDAVAAARVLADARGLTLREALTVAKGGVVASGTRVEVACVAERLAACDVPTAVRRVR
jgi:rRNA maturation protein Nop10